MSCNHYSSWALTVPSMTVVNRSCTQKSSISAMDDSSTAILSSDCVNGKKTNHEQQYPTPYPKPSAISGLRVYPRPDSLRFPQRHPGAILFIRDSQEASNLALAFRQV